jgi:UDP-3-O-acyl-N-acetylglucosamine deacetylase
LASLGANLENTLVIGRDSVLNANLQRFEDEFVGTRFSMSSAIAPAGCGASRTLKAGASHALNNALARLFAMPRIMNYSRPIKGLLGAKISSRAHSQNGLVAVR